MKKALLVSDLQNDYFPGGLFPLWNTEAVLANIKKAIAKAQEQQMPVVLIQHVADAKAGIAPFFNAGTEGVAIHPEISAVATHAPVVVKAYADSFYQTTLDSVLKGLGVDELLLCGMMTQNCVTHTALSQSAEFYKVSIVSDCCTTVSEMLHLIALHALSTRTPLLPLAEAL